MTKKNSSSFGEMLKIFRKRRHFTQQQLVEVIGVHRSTLVNWEQGNYLPGSKAMVLELARHLHLDDQETRQLLEASLTALTPYWCVPFPRNPFFTGREDILETLHTQLSVDQTVALTQSSALHGLGGVGKTQIALEYAYRHALEYSAVFWIGAETEEQIVSSFLRIAEVLQLPGREDNDRQRVVAAVQRWLSTHGQWLLIWDNAEDLEALDRFLPVSRSGAILITTRCQTVGTFARGLDLVPMEQEEGMLFLLRRAKMLEPEAAYEDVRHLVQSQPIEYAGVSELVTILGGLPLALDQAGAYLEATRCGLPAYVELFRTRCAALLKLRGECTRDHPASVFTTFALALTATARRHPAVLDLLHVCALLQPDAIPEELFRQGAEHLGPRLSATCRDPLEWDRVVSIASSYSLLTRQPEQQTLSFHRLVQAVLHDTMTERERAAWSRQAIEALDAIFPQQRATTKHTPWNEYRRLLPHALLLLQRAGGAEESLTLASLADKTGQYLLHGQGDHVQGETLLQHAHALRERLLGADHPLVAASLRALADASQTQGKYAQAEEYYHRALSEWEKTAEPDDWEMASILHGLGFVFWQQGKDEQAEECYHRALSTWEKVSRLHDPEGASSFHGLALLSHHQGQSSQAEALYRRARQIWEQTLGPDHAMVGHALKNLADLYREQGNAAQAKGLYQRAWQIWEQALGPDHPWVAYALHGLALLSHHQGRYSEADALFQRVLAIREQQLGLQHPETAETLSDLALLRQKQGRLNEACSFAEHAHSIRSQSLGDAHPKTTATRVLHAQLLQEKARAEGKAASESHRQALPARCESECSQDRDSSPLHTTTPPASSQNDPLQGFLETCCELHPRAWGRSADLWGAYQQWVEQHQERYPLSRGAFIAQLKAHGCRAERTMSARIWRGIALVKKEA